MRGKTPNGWARRRIGQLLMALVLAAAVSSPAMGAVSEPVDAATDAAQRWLIPGGQSVGIAVETRGLVVVGTSDLGKAISPARSAGLRAGDVITKVDGNAVNQTGDIVRLIAAGTPAELTIVRDERIKTIQLTPVADARDGSARIGAWVRNTTAGVGTLSFVDPQNGNFATLGHAISDLDTGIRLPVATGKLYESEVVEINRGRAGAPGEIVGDFFAQEKVIGRISRNTDYGLYGKDYSGESALYPQGLPADSSQAHTGAATLLTTVDDQTREYACEITKLDADGANRMRTITLKITDASLIEKTGGIVQGMSGSPILQDGRIIGAVTHVFVNDPTQGYGIRVETMLEQMEATPQTAAA